MIFAPMTLIRCPCPKQAQYSHSRPQISLQKLLFVFSIYVKNITNTDTERLIEVSQYLLPFSDQIQTSPQVS